jgi:hypothetical protein
LLDDEVEQFVHFIAHGGRGVLCNRTDRRAADKSEARERLGTYVDIGWSDRRASPGPIKASSRAAVKL